MPGSAAPVTSVFWNAMLSTFPLGYVLMSRRLHPSVTPLSVLQTLESLERHADIHRLQSNCTVRPREWAACQFSLYQGGELVIFFLSLL